MDPNRVASQIAYSANMFAISTKRDSSASARVDGVPFSRLYRSSA
jgi:hypothetical protein